jgi:putative thioredoxin
MSMPPLPPSLKGLGSLGGAFDLGSLRQPAVTIDPDELGYVVTQENLIAELLPASNDAVAIILCWSPRSSQAQSLIPMMRQFNRDDQTAEGDPTWIFGTVNVDAEPAVAKALQVQSVPLAIAIIQEQLVPLFESIPPAEQVRAVINKVIELAAQKGVGSAPTSDSGEAQLAEPPLEPEEEIALAALETGDLLAAKAAYESLINRVPGNALAKLAVVQIDLMIRTEGLNFPEEIAKADANPADIAQQLRAADCEIAEGDFDASSNRLLTLIRTVAGDDRMKVRDHLLMIFSLVDPADPHLAKARQHLASALF